jgi:hypothetical protein
VIDYPEMVYFFDNRTLLVEINANHTHCVELARLHFSPGGGPDYAASAGTPQGQGKRPFASLRAGLA